MIDQHLFYIIGGGFAGIQTIRSLIHHGIPPKNITLITPDDMFLFTPLLHETALGHLPSNLIETKIQNIFPKIRIHLDSVSNIDLHTNIITTQKGTTFNADFIVIATGSRALNQNIPGLFEHTIPLKSLRDARMIQKEFENARSIIILGGGATGVEIAAETITHNKSVHLITAGKSVIPSFSTLHQEYVAKYLEQKGIQVHLEWMLDKIENHAIHSRHGEKLSSDLIINALGVEPNYPDFTPSVHTDGKKRLIVDEFLRLQGYSHIFVAGDTASGDPMDAQAAEYHAKLVAKNIIHTCNREHLCTRNYIPKGKLLSLGQKNGIAEIGPLRLRGFYVWFLWRTIYLMKMPGIRKRLSVARVWTLLLFRKTQAP